MTVASFSSFRLRLIHWEQMRAHVAGEAPLEACGLVAGQEGVSTMVFPMENELASQVRYRIPARAQLEAFMDMEENDWEFMAIYHSHPQGPATPSAADLAEATYPEAIQLIWMPLGGDWQCQAFTFSKSGFRAAEVETLK
jgi:proteasome lid subunit RPN8/RPN11